MAVVQTKSSGRFTTWDAGSTKTVTFDAPVTAGNAVIVCVMYGSVGNQSIDAVTDDRGGGSNTYALLTEGGTNASAVTAAEKQRYQTLTGEG